MAAWTKTIARAVIELFFPEQCLVCGEDGEYVCKDCIEQWVILRPSCFYCQRLTETGVLCSVHRARSSLTGVYVTTVYIDAVRHLIHLFKYEGMRALAPIFGKLLAERLCSHIKKEAVLIPIPLHRARFIMRGYNQSALLAKEISRRSGVPVDDHVLRRNRFTLSQVGLSRTARQHNLKGAFTLVKECNYHTIVLVDDVATSGATLEEAARTLRLAGASRVWGLVIAKG